MILTARSGGHALRSQLEAMNYSLNDDEFADFYQRFIELADRKKEVYREDLEALLIDVSYADPIYELEYLHTVGGTRTIPAAVVVLRRGEECLEAVSSGTGPIDAAYKAVDMLTALKIELGSFNIRAVTQGMDALGEVSITIRHEDKNIIGRGMSTDIIEASVKAYLDGINKLLNIQAHNNQNHNKNNKQSGRVL